MMQSDLFHDSIYDALGADIAAAGGVKKVAALLWPAKEDAAGRLRACLSVEHSQKLDADEILKIKKLARAAGSNATVNYEAQQIGFAITWLEPETERDELDRRIAASLESLIKLLGHRERKFGALK